jgi:hypothetical protein
VKTITMSWDEYQNELRNAQKIGSDMEWTKLSEVIQATTGKPLDKHVERFREIQKDREAQLASALKMHGVVL